MQIPNYIEKALEHRINAVNKFNSADIIISEFIDKHGINVDPADYRGGCESIASPEISAEHIREAILNYKK